VVTMSWAPKRHRAVPSEAGGKAKRDTAMSAQAELVMRKKAEIEAKMAKAEERAAGVIKEKKPISLSIGKRWGLKGKREQQASAAGEAVPPSSAPSLPSVLPISQPFYQQPSAAPSTTSYHPPPDMSRPPPLALPFQTAPPPPPPPLPDMTQPPPPAPELSPPSTAHSFLHSAPPPPPGHNLVAPPPILPDISHPPPPPHSTSLSLPPMYSANHAQLPIYSASLVSPLHEPPLHSTSLPPPSLTKPPPTQTCLSSNNPPTVGAPLPAPVHPVPPPVTTVPPPVKLVLPVPPPATSVPPPAPAFHQTAPSPIAAAAPPASARPGWWTEAVAQAREAASLSREHCGGGEPSPPSRRRFTEERDLPAAPPARKRKSRWGDSNAGEEGSLLAPTQPGLALPTALGQPALAAPAPARPPALVAYATRVFGSTAGLTEAQWKQCEQQLQLGAVYGELAAKQARAAAGKQMKFEYDSDEDIEGGTWEHKARQLEMEKTQSEAERSNQLLSGGTSHIGDFLPPEEFDKFMNKYKALQSGVPGDTSAFQENKLTEENKGFKMLQVSRREGRGDFIPQVSSSIDE